MPSSRPGGRPMLKRLEGPLPRGVAQAAHEAGKVPGPVPQQGSRMPWRHGKMPVRPMPVARRAPQASDCSAR
eukprot:11988246-Alexandrium_andersonii.AAC.1